MLKNIFESEKSWKRILQNIFCTEIKLFCKDLGKILKKILRSEKLQKKIYQENLKNFRKKYFIHGKNSVTNFGSEKF